MKTRSDDLTVPMIALADKAELPEHTRLKQKKEALSDRELFF